MISDTQKNRDWVAAYMEHMISDRIEEALILKLKYFPSRLFKYRKLNENTLNSLNDKYFWLTKISSLNDPFESSIQFDVYDDLRHMFSDPLFKADFKQNFNKDLSDDEINVLITSPDPLKAHIDLLKSHGFTSKLDSIEQLKAIQQKTAKIVEDSSSNI